MMRRVDSKKYSDGGVMFPRMKALKCYFGGTPRRVKSIANMPYGLSL
jgi:hypothetical protein